MSECSRKYRRWPGSLFRPVVDFESPMSVNCVVADFDKRLCVVFPARFSGRQCRRLRVSLYAQSVTKRCDKIALNKSKNPTDGRDVDVAIVLYCLLTESPIALIFLTPHRKQKQVNAKSAHA